MNIEPQRAAVKPRIRTRDVGSVPLENELLPLLHAEANGIIALLGGTGSGRTAALRHLACMIPEDCRVHLFDNEKSPAVLKKPGLVIYTGDRQITELRHIAAFRLAPWSNDDLIEYLLAKHREQCASVMARVNAAEGAKLLGGNPELWSVALDEFAADATLKKFSGALLKHLNARLDSALMAQPRLDCLGKTIMTNETIIRTRVCRRKMEAGDVRINDLRWFDHILSGDERWRLFRHEAVRMILAREQILADLRADSGCHYFVFRFARLFIRMLASSVKENPALLEKLRVLALNPDLQAMTSSTLHAAGVDWIPDSKTGFNLLAKKTDLGGAYLDRVQWPGLTLDSASFRCADLSNADLAGAELLAASFTEANCRHARMRGIKLKNVGAPRANFSHADLSEAKAMECHFIQCNFGGASLQNAHFWNCDFEGSDFSEASLRRCYLKHARFYGAKIDGADFSQCDLTQACLMGLRLRDAKFTGAIFHRADLRRCDLESMELPAADFSGADLSNAILTASFIPKGNFEGAILSRTGLADIQWERANLRNADLRGCTFHMGSTRSGRVDSDIACEGSRTGFYTDDYFDQPFKAPEEIRKANLRGADLRGAKLDKTDFYLVDLRDAKYDPDQAEHLRRCGAILESRV